MLWFLFGFNCIYSQQNLKSISQKQCQWNIQTHNYEQCEEVHINTDILINQSKGAIQINNTTTNKNFKIISTVDKNGELLFKVVSETGTGKIITYNKNKNWIRLSDERQSKSSIGIYYLINK